MAEESGKAESSRPSIATFIRRMNASITRSPLLKVSARKTGRHVDVTRFRHVGKDCDWEVVDALLSGKRMAVLNFSLRETSQAALLGDDAETENGDPDLRERQVLFRQLENLRRAGDLARRETGIYALWMGYPLIYVPTGTTDDDPWILAPLFLFPAAIQLNARREGQVHICRADIGPVRFNSAMSAWLARNLRLETPTPTADDLAGLTGDSLRLLLQGIGSVFQPPIAMPPLGLTPVPATRTLSARDGARFISAAVLGIFRWQNESILTDLQAIDKQASLKGLVQGFVEGERKVDTGPLPIPVESDRFLVTDSDFSQQRVVWRARSGPGLVVHGPPGTGKSQTIVNIVADALGHGQTVLMVCQKEAATRVVMQRLRAVGLERLCLEVHDPEAERQGVFREIRDRVETLSQNWIGAIDEQRARLSSHIEELEQKLDAFSRAMHEVHPDCGVSYRRVTAIEGAVLRADRSVRALASLVEVGKVCRQSELEPLVQLSVRMGDLFTQSNYLDNLWRYRTDGFEPSGTVSDDVTFVLSKCKDIDVECQSLLSQSEHADSVPWSADNVSEGVAAATKAIQAVGSLSPELKPLVLKWVQRLQADTKSVTEIRQRVEQLAVLSREVQNLPLDPTWYDVLKSRGELDVRTTASASELICRLSTRWWRGLSRDYRDSVRWIRSQRPDAMGKRVLEVAAECVSHMKARQIRQAFLKALQSETLDSTTDNDEASCLRQARRISDSFAVASPIAECIAAFDWTSGAILDALRGDGSESQRSLSRIHHIEHRARVVATGVGYLHELSAYLKTDAVNQLTEWFVSGKSVRSSLDRLADGLARFSALRDFDGALSAIDGHRRAVVVALIDYEKRRSGGMPVPQPSTASTNGGWWALLTKLSIATAWKGLIRQRHPILDQMSADQHDHLALELRDALQKKKDLEVPAILKTWQDRQFKAVAYPWQAIFKLRGAKGSPAPKLREAVQLGIKKDLFAFAPCWLTNPSAAAQIFPLVEGLFDVVVFDEASQCPLEQALPALFRATRAVIAGDEKQLPPTSFFAPESDSQSDEDVEQDAATPISEEAEDARVRELLAQNVVDSGDLLNAAVAMLSEEYLRVHYRSEHPALIEFSNRAFYAGRLEAPPTRILTTSADPPIRFVKCAGVYESGKRINRVEAAEVVKLIKAVICADGTTPTVGVVTFNLPQRDLIQDLLEQERTRDPQFAARYEQEIDRKESNQDVSLFVKNLENVQGDERDVMIFSTTFGRNEVGQFRRLFGPVGQEGGERRLNVAVTRAKQGVIVVSSMPIEEISPALKAGLGSGVSLVPKDYLHLYLSYSKAVSSGDTEAIGRILGRLGSAPMLHAGGGVESVLEAEVLDFVSRLGYEVHPQVGESGFRIDLAVVHPTKARGYVLGIECDGAAYHSDRSARLRDVWRQAILERRGWRMCRVWSTRWWGQRDEEANRIRFAIEEAVAAMG